MIDDHGSGRTTASQIYAIRRQIREHALTKFRIYGSGSIKGEFVVLEVVRASGTELRWPATGDDLSRFENKSSRRRLIFQSEKRVVSGRECLWSNSQRSSVNVNKGWRCVSYESGGGGEGGGEWWVKYRQIFK